MQKSRRELFKEEIDRAIETSSPYAATDRHLHWVYATGLLRELLSYSALDQWEVRRRIEQLQKQPKRKQ